MQAEHEDDPEGYLLQEARRILGEKSRSSCRSTCMAFSPTGCSRTATRSSPTTPIRTSISFETGDRAARLLLQILTGGARPVTARVKIPALVRGDELITETGSIGECIRLAQQIEAVLSRASRRE